MLHLNSNFSKSMLTLTALLVSACGGSPSSLTPIIPPISGEQPSNPDQPIPDGIWIQKGFGRAINVTGESVTTYDYTRETCLNDGTITQDDITAILAIESVTSQELVASEDATKLIFSKRDGLPPACLDNRLITEDGPVSTLNHFIHNFSDYYPFFEARGLSNWDERIANARLNVNNQTTNEELLNELVALLSGLDDGHVSLLGDGETLLSPSSLAGTFIDVLVNGFENQSEITDFDEYASIQFGRFEDIRNSYFDDGRVETAGGEDGDIFQWATIGSGRVGYVQINSMNSISETGAESDVTATENIMDRILTDFAHTEALIVNVMINDGGDLAIADAIANRFTAETLAVSSYEAISYDDSAMPQTTPLVHRELSPTERISYDRPIATISGPNSVSAAEHFLISMRALKHPVCFVGEPSNGILSAILGKDLPTKGWRLNVSNQIIYDHTGQNFEVSGVPVDIDAVTFATSGPDTEKNEAIEAALMALGFGYLVNNNAPADDCSLKEARMRFELSAPYPKGVVMRTDAPMEQYQRTVE